ncbi:MAG: glycosyltransferase family 2 protein [Dehalococcoidia bacterium]|nr:MAG: glycosyltransferase family 2 protein [Dehalococcoidia bacterium]
MNFVELVFILGFIETAILFFYAIRWYIFAFVSLKCRPSTINGEGKCKSKFGFVSVLLPIYNEPNVVDRLLKACTSFNSPLYEVVVVDDSSDGVTTEKLRVWNSNPLVKVIHRSSREGWKGGALNVGLEHINPKSTHVLIFDADFVPPKNLITRFLSKFDHNSVAVVQGYQRHNLNAEENWITKGVRVWTSLYNMVELNGQQKAGLFSPLTGCVFMMRTDLLKKLKFEEVTDEDWNLTMRIYENGYKIIYDPSLMASGECPNTLKRLFRQQARWAEGHTRTFRCHFLKIWRCKFLRLREKIDFTFIGASFLNSVLIVVLSLAGLITLFNPTVYLPLLIVQLSTLLLLASIPSAIIASLVALSLEDSKKDYSKIGYAWLLNFVVTPVLAFAALKGLLTRKGFFHRTHKTGRITKKSSS